MLLQCVLNQGEKCHQSKKMLRQGRKGHQGRKVLKQGRACHHGRLRFIWVENVVRIESATLR